MTSFGDGGGFLTDAIPTLTMANLHLTNVVSTGGDYGGGRVVVQQDSSVSLSDSSFVDCTAGRGGRLRVAMRACVCLCVCLCVLWVCLRESRKGRGG